MVATLAASPPAPPASGPAEDSPSAVTSPAAAPEAAPATAPPAPASPASSPSPAAAAIPGALDLQSTRAGGAPVVVRDEAGEVVANLYLRPGGAVRLTLPPGIYSIEDSVQGGRLTLSVESGKRSRFQLRPDGARGIAGEGPQPLPALGFEVQRARTGPVRPRWKRVVAPLFSAAVPGLGQLLNRQPAKGAGILLSTIALGIGSAALMGASGGTDVSGRGLGSDSFRTEALSAFGYGFLSGGLQMLYAAQIMDAYATAAGKTRPRPRTRHNVSLEWTRMATIGLRPGDPAAGFFADWNVSVLGQVARRFSVGAGDLSIKQGRGFARTSLQGGLRLHYRFLDRDRVWLGAAAGVILQGSFAQPAANRVDRDAPRPDTEGSFASVVYAQFDLRYFMLDRWSLNLIPRISAPLAGPRFYGGPGDRVVPQNALTLELGTGVGVYF